MKASRKLEGKTGEVAKLPPDHLPPDVHRQPPKLETLGEVKQEIARVYRAVWEGRIAVGDGTRLTYMLTQLSKTIEAQEKLDEIDALLAKIPFRGLSVIGPGGLERIPPRGSMSGSGRQQE